MSDPYAVFDELVDALDSVRRQQRLVVRLFGVVLIVMLAGVVGLFYFTQDLPKEAAFPDGRVQAVEKDVADVKASVRQSGAEMKTGLTAIAEKIEKLEQDVARLSARVGSTDMRAGPSEAPVARAEPAPNLPGANLPGASLPGAGVAGTSFPSPGFPNPGEPARNDTARAADESAATAQASVPEGAMVAAPLPRRRPSAQTVAARAAATPPFATAATGPGELKPGAQIAPGQFALRPIPDELETKMPRLKGKMFFRHDGEIYVVDPKDNKIVELLKQN